ncbi:MAG: serine hydrolase domain-containing protein [Rhodothermales bacterium]
MPAAFRYILLLILILAVSTGQSTSAQSIDGLLDRAEELNPLSSLLISQNGELLGARYYRGMKAGKTINVKSVSKSLLSPLVGIAIRDGLLENTQQKLADLLPDYADEIAVSHRDEITLHHVLSMTTGLEGTSFQNYGAWVTSKNWVKFALEQPVACDPAACMTYSTGNSHLISVILSKASGKDLRSYARDVLFRPLGIHLPSWDKDPQGYYLGGNNIGLRPLDMLRFGELYLNKGMYKGKQLVPASWIEKSWKTYATSPWNGHHHGYYWWSRNFAGYQTHFAWGYGGQYIFIVPKLELVVVFTSSLRNRPRGVDHNHVIQDFLVNDIIPTIEKMGASN